MPAEKYRTHAFKKIRHLYVDAPTDPLLVSCLPHTERPR